MSGIRTVPSNLATPIASHRPADPDQQLDPAQLATRATRANAPPARAWSPELVFAAWALTGLVLALGALAVALMSRFP